VAGLELAEKLGKYATPTLHEVSSEVRPLAPAIFPLYRPVHLWGPAFPVLTITGDNRTIHFALAKVPSGSVLTVATGQDTHRGYWGEILMEAAIARGVRGLVIDGGIRDTRTMRERAFPVFCGAIAIQGTVKSRLGVLNQPVIIGQVLIRPGDFVVGDDDGVVVIPLAVASQVLEAAEARVQKETRIIQRVKQGELTVDVFDLRSKE